MSAPSTVPDGGRRPRPHWPREHLRRLLVITIVVFTATAAAMFGHILHAHMRLAGDARDNVLWTAAQLEHEGAAVQSALGRMERQPTSANRDAAALAYDVLYNRVHIATEGEFAGMFAGKPEAAAALATVRDVVYGLAPDVDGLATGDAAGAGRLADALARTEEPLQRLLMAAAQVNAEQTAAQRAATLRRYIRLGMLLGGVTITVGLFIMLLVHQLRLIQAGHRDLQSLLDRAADGVFALKPDGSIGYLNPAAERMFGASAAEILGRPATELLPGLPAVLAGNGSPPEDGTTATHELQGYRRGESFDLELSVGRGASLGSAVVFMRDVSARKRTEEQLRHRQKLEVLGRLAGGVAHDFNNLLMVVDGYARQALRHIEDRARVETALGEIARAAASAARLTRQLLSFSGKRSLDVRPVRLAEVVEGAEGLLRSTVGEAVNLVIDPIDPALCVDTDPVELTHALLNIVVNARDAMPGGGEVAVRVAPAELAAGAVAGLAPGHYVQIAVSDQGTGMDESTLARIFEPFFTTKDPARGTGLGLSTVYGFARQSGGTVTATSAPGQGSTFRIYLPRSAGGPVPLARTAEVPRGHGETILLVEDNAPILRLTSAVLQGLGYRVLAALDAAGALAVAEAHDGPIALLLSDVVMPSMSGIELAAVLRRSRPTMKVLFMSGYPGRGEGAGPVLPDGALLLRKPVGPEELGRAVRAVLDGERRPAAA
ncbi:MAG: response regulator [Rhodospirillaceae bacterium]|nr:response regulator [Rhodospirillaceae bacterium]